MYARFCKLSWARIYFHYCSVCSVCMFLLLDEIIAPRVSSSLGTPDCVFCLDAKHLTLCTYDVRKSPKCKQDKKRQFYTNRYSFIVVKDTGGGFVLRSPSTSPPPIHTNTHIHTHILHWNSLLSLLVDPDMTFCNYCMFLTPPHSMTDTATAIHLEYVHEEEE